MFSASLRRLVDNSPGISRQLRRYLHPEYSGPFSDLVERIRYNSERRDESPHSAVRLIRLLSRQKMSEAQSKEIKHLLEKLVTRGVSGMAVMDSALELRRVLKDAGTPEILIPATVLQAYAHARQSFCQRDGRVLGSDHRELRAQVTELLASGTRAETIELFCWLCVAATQGEADTLTGLCSLSKRIEAWSATRQEMRIVGSAAIAHIMAQQPLASLRQGIDVLLCALGALHTEQKDILIEEVTAPLVEMFRLPITKPYEAGALLSGAGTLIEEGARGWVLRTFLRAAYPYAVANDPKLVSLVAHHCLRLGDYDPPTAHLEAFLAATEPGQDTLSTRDILDRLQRLGAHTVALAMTGTAGIDPQRKTFVNDLARFTAEHGKEPVHVLIPHNHHISARALFNFGRIADWHHGFGAYTFLARRPPSGEPWLQARFAAAVGECLYVNAREVNSFPGRGVLIRNIQLERVLVSERDRAGRATFAAYRHAWPGLAHELNDLQETTFVFTRGLIAVIPPDTDKYKLNPYDEGVDTYERYALIIFNDHFENPDTAVACILPARILKNKLEGCAVGYHDYTGVSTDHFDVNSRGLSIQALRREAGDSLFEVGNAGTLLRGLENAAVPSSRIEFEQLSNELRDLIRQSGGPADDLLASHLMSMLYMTRREQRKAERLEERLKTLNHSMEIAYRSRANFSRRLEEVLTPLLNLLDLLRLTQAIWHKGHTAQQVMGERSAQVPAVISPIRPNQSALAFDAENAVYNPEATRMLREALDWHSLRSRGVHDPTQFPIFASAPTLRSSAAPDGRVVLDSYSLELSVHGRRIQLTPTSNGNDIEDALVWMTQVLPILGSSLDDIRPFHRDSMKRSHATDTKESVL